MIGLRLLFRSLTFWIMYPFRVIGSINIASESAFNSSEQSAFESFRTRVVTFSNSITPSFKLENIVDSFKIAICKEFYQCIIISNFLVHLFSTFPHYLYNCKSGSRKIWTIRYLWSTPGQWSGQSFPMSPTYM